MKLTPPRSAVFVIALAFFAGFFPGAWSADDAHASGRGPVLGAPFDALAELNANGSDYFKCRADCAKKAFEGLRTCLKDGGDPRTCAEQARTALESCVATACAGIQPPCRLGCAQSAQAGYKACVDGGGTPSDCAAQAREALKTCLAQCPTPPWMCRLECQKTGAEAYRACRDNGGERQACAEAAQAAVKACIDNNCAGAQPTP